MPYKSKDDETLPDHVKAMGDADREQWVAVWNDTYDKCQASGGEDCEGEAMKAANGAVARMVKRFMTLLRNLVIGVKRTIKDVENWDGSAANYPDTVAYCKACLIDVNEAAGKTDKTQDHCMLPVRGTGDNVDTFVRQAVHAAVGGHGITQVVKPADVPQDAWDNAVKTAATTLIRAYDEMGEDAPESLLSLAGKVSEQRASSISQIADAAMSAFYEDEALQGFWINDIYADTNGVFMVCSANGKLYKIDVKLTDDAITFGDPVEVAVNFTDVAGAETPKPGEMEEEGSDSDYDDYGSIGVDMHRMVIRRQADGVFRWVSVSCSAVINRNGAIDSTRLFDSFVEHAEQTGEYPIRQFYHQGAQFRTGQCDFIARDGFLLVTSGVFDDTELARNEIKARMAEPDYWGESIGFMHEGFPALVEVANGVEVPIYTKGKITEISTLPEGDASAWFTNSQVLEVNRMLQGKQLEAFVKLFGGDEMAAKAWLEQNVDETNRSIKDAGMVARATEPTEQTEPVTPPAPVQDFVIDEETLGIIVSRAAESLTAAMAPVQDELRASLTSLGEQITAINAQVTGLTTRMDALSKTEEAKRQQWLADLPRSAQPQKVIYRPRQVAAPETEQPEQPDMARQATATLATLPKI